MIYEAQNEELKEFVKNIKTYFEQEKNIVIYDKRNIIKIVEFEGQKYVVKSFKIPHLFNQIVYRFFRASKAKRSFENSYKLERLGIKTPKPMGYIEFPTRFKFKESFYIAEFFDFDFEIRAVFKDMNFKDRENILEKFVEYSYNLHQKEVYHIDYSPGNILVKNVNNRYIFSIIDVNRMKFLKFNNHLRMKSLAKLTNSKQDNDFMLKHYVKISQIDANILRRELSFALHKQERYLVNKKRLKKLKD